MRVFPGGSTLSARIDGLYQAAPLTQDLQVELVWLGYSKYAYMGSQTIGNLSATCASDGDRYSISAYVRNFTNRQYIGYLVQGDPTSLGESWTDPRTYGAMASVRF